MIASYKYLSSVIPLLIFAHLRWVNSFLEVLVYSFKFIHLTKGLKCDIKVVLPRACAGERGRGKGSACALGKKRMACGGKGAGEGKRMRTRKKTDGLRDFIFSMHYSEKNGWLARFHL